MDRIFALVRLSPKKPSETKLTIGTSWVIANPPIFRSKRNTSWRRTDKTPPPSPSYGATGFIGLMRLIGCANPATLRRFALSPIRRFAPSAGARGRGRRFPLAFAHFSPFHGDHTNVVVEVFSRRKTTDLVNNGREELFHWQSCHTVEARDE